MRIEFTLNKKKYSADAAPGDRLIDIIRDQLGFTGTKLGCGIGECGACTIVVNGEAVNSCLIMASQADGSDILTVEGLSHQKIGEILQQCFMEHGAVQCGFCTPGMLMSAYALLEKNPSPTKDEIKMALAGNFCRCTGYKPIVDAITAAKAQLNSR